MAEVVLDLSSPSDRGRLRGWVDNAPRLMSRADGVGNLALDDFWREALIKLLDLLDQPPVSVHHSETPEEE